MILERASGVLLHPTSLPSRHGIGDLGKGAYDFVDFLQASGQKYWQILPLGPTGYEHSPYIMNYSTFAGNPLLISLEKLVDQGLLQGDELTVLPHLPHSRRDWLEFDRVIPHKIAFLRQAYDRFRHNLQHDRHYAFEDFCNSQPWLEDYVLFMALAEQYPEQAWNQWPSGLARRDPQALAEQRQALSDQLQFHRFLQFTFFDQWRQIRHYANERGIRIIGDISIYVCYHSADVWASPELFQLKPDSLEPAFIAGVPPDYFSETGQLWGNPVYNWEKMQETGFRWWIDRFRATLNYADLVRIDHFRGFEAYWRVPGGEKTAINGEWVPAPGHAFFQRLRDELGYLPVLAEDLGTITPEVEEMRDRYEFPGMKILQFAFGGDQTNPYLPYNYPHNAVVYPGTHDNDTALGWWQTLNAAEKQKVTHFLGYDRPEEVKEIHWELIRTALRSPANLAILPLQDLLGLDGQSRMNDPAVNEGNWRWRYPFSHQLSPELSQRLLKLTQIYRRG
ncbi:MAG: 4-alpha-glucanotransferase [Prochlorotrichaceae cyanobacterium]|jgi:4-alpha-glucanotransferase